MPFSEFELAVFHPILHDSGIIDVCRRLIGHGHAVRVIDCVRRRIGFPRFGYTAQYATQWFHDYNCKVPPAIYSSNNRPELTITHVLFIALCK